MKVTKIALITLFSLGIPTLTGFVGYHMGYRSGWRDDYRNFVGECLDKDILLYRKAESDGIEGVKDDLTKYISGELQYYEQHYGTNRSVHLDAAREIVSSATTSDKR